jgi:hypothetical protein
LSLADVAKLALFLGLAYFIYWKIFMVYYKYWYYKSQGVSTLGLPWPIINNGVKMLKAFSKMNDVKWTVLEEYWHSGSGYSQLPPILAEFSSPLGMLIISDPGPGEGFVLRKEPTHGEVYKDAENSLEIYRPLNLVRPLRPALG